MREYYVYMMSNVSRRLYIGSTSNLERRVYAHQMKLLEGFTRKYNLTMLVYYEASETLEGAYLREKQLKGWLRQRKIELIESSNPDWRDLSRDWL